MKLEILTNPNPLLRKKAKDITLQEISSSENQKFINDMIETMYAEKGIGLAATQVGVLKRILIAEQGSNNPFPIINPVVVSRSLRKTKSEEGCLSVPGKIGIVKRHTKIHIKALDRNGKKLDLKADGMFAIILQHEIDHLDGILFIDKAEKVVDVNEKKNL